MTDTPPCQPETLPDDTDLYCLECGYNLRGLSGDPRRCPECFHLNPVGDLVIPAEQIKRQIRKMETAPALCVAALLLVIPSVLAVVLGGMVPCFVVAALAGLALWLVGIARFGNSCEHRLGWRWALVRYHFFGAAMVGIVVGTWVGWLWALHEVLAPRLWSSGGLAFVLTEATVLVALAVLLYAPIRWMYRQARKGFDQLQRQVAVHIIRTRHRRLLESRP